MEASNAKKVLRGTVASKAMNKTIVVEIATLKTHPKYQKKYRVTKRYKVHDPENSCKVGEVVNFVACKPISKDKKFVVSK